MKKVISIVLNNFVNDSRVLKEAQTLSANGYEVKVIALHEGTLNEFETVGGIKIHRINLRSKNWFKIRAVQVLKYIELVFVIIKNYRDIDVVHCNDLETLPLGVILKKIDKKIKIVYDAHEYETETHYSKGIRKKIAQKLERFLIKYVDRTITVSETIANEYVKLYNIKKPALVLNTPFYQEVEKTDIFRRKFKISKEKTIFLYQGALNYGRGIEILLEAFKVMHDKYTIVFMGYGLLEASIREASKNYNNIYLHEAVAPTEVLSYTSSADFGISTIEDSCLSYRYCLPNKMFEYMMVGLPVIVSNLPEMKKVVETFNVGVVLDENTINGITEAVEKSVKLDRKILEDNLKLVRDKYNWEEQEIMLLNVYNEL